jgi:hypothetical protein
MRFSAALCAVWLLQLPVMAAQQEPKPQPPTTVLTGCLVSTGADPQIAGPSGRLYTLEVTEAPATPPATATASGTPRPAASTTTTYALSAPEALDLEKHAGQRVELTGSLQAPSVPDSASGSAGTPQPKPGGAHRTFNVTALKGLGEKCAS